MNTTRWLGAWLVGTVLMGCGAADTSGLGTSEAEEELRSGVKTLALPPAWRLQDGACGPLENDGFACPRLKLWRYSGDLPTALRRVASREGYELESKTAAEARALFEDRFGPQLAFAGDEGGSRSEVLAVGEFYRGFFQTAERLGESVYFADTYWAPSVNSGVFLFVNEEKKQIIRLEHGDTDG